MAENRDGALTYLIYNKSFDETYTAHVKKNGSGWVGWIPDVPKVKCQEQTVEAVQEKLPNILHETLVSGEETWQKQYEQDVNSGKLDHLIQKAKENYKAGRYSKIVTNNE